ncbi:hypothetical protein ABZT03_00085 [Streptomyces sp. NPDC005574]|uniref:hypothetical protein n=1 Tax=Streptomyces sp. NPDC005574 TaxID=3156891 RepID=UPI0033AB6C6C
MSRDKAGTGQDVELEKTRARYGLLAVVVSNVAIAGVAAFGVWRLGGDKAVIVGVLTAAFTAVSGTTTAYLGIKAVSNTARSIALGEGIRREAAPLPAPLQVPASAPAGAPTTAPAPATDPAAASAPSTATDPVPASAPAPAPAPAAPAAPASAAAPAPPAPRSP